MLDPHIFSLIWAMDLSTREQRLETNSPATPLRMHGETFGYSTTLQFFYTTLTIPKSTPYTKC